MLIYSQMGEQMGNQATETWENWELLLDKTVSVSLNTS